MLLEPAGIIELTLRPMKYPRFYDMYTNAIKNTWTVEEVDFSSDFKDLEAMTPAERHMIQRLVAFFATGDELVANNLVINFYERLNAPEARMYLSRQLYEEALHIQFYLVLLDNYITDQAERTAAFKAIEDIPSIKRKGDFCMKWMKSTNLLGALHGIDYRRKFLENLICFSCCVEGLFFFGAFAYVYFLRSKGLLHGLADGTNWVFRDESAHMEFAFEVIRTARQEEPDIFDQKLTENIYEMMDEAIACEAAFAEDLLGGGIAGLPTQDMVQYLQYVADSRLATLGLPKRYLVRNPFPFMELQDLQELTNFFERRSTSYQSAVSGEVSLNKKF